MPRKRVLITLPTNAYRRLAAMAENEERVIDQQASLLLKRLLIDTFPPSESAPMCGDKSPSPAKAIGREGGRS